MYETTLRLLSEMYLVWMLALFVVASIQLWLAIFFHDVSSLVSAWWMIKLALPVFFILDERTVLMKMISITTSRNQHD